MDDNNTTSIFNIGFFTGLVIGLAIGLLYAPQSDEKTRTMLRDKVLEIQEKASEVAEKLK